MLHIDTSKDSTPAQYLFDAVANQRAYMQRYKALSKSEIHAFRDLYVQLAWNNRQSARNWAEDLTMTRDEHERREVQYAINRLSHDVTHWRDHCKMTSAQVVERVRAWGEKGDWAYSPAVRIKAASVILDILL